MDQRVGRWLLLLGTLVFGVLGQLYFAKRPDNFWDGVVFYAVAAVCLWLLARQPEQAPQAGESHKRSRGRGDWVRLGMAVVGVALGALAVLQLARPQHNYWPVFWIWVVGMAFVLVAALPEPRTLWRAMLRTVRSVDPWEALAVLGLVSAALALRVWRVDTIPWTLSGDEGNFGRWARQVLDGKVTNMFATGHLSMPSLYAFFQAGWLKLAGDNTFGLRLPWAVVGTFSVLGCYMLVRRLFGRGLALLVTLLLAGYSYHIHYSRLALNNIADPFFVVWTLYFLVVGCQSGRKWAWTVTGLLAGLAFYFYTGGRQTPVILAGLLVWIAFVDRNSLSRSRGHVLGMLVGFLVAVGPMALFAFQHGDDFNARINQVGILQSGWLDQVAQLQHKSRWLVLAEQFRRVLFAFNHFLDNTDFYKPAKPLLDFPMSILFLLGTVLSATRIAERPASEDPHLQHDYPRWRYAVFIIWFLVVIVSGGVLTVDAPSSQRILSSCIPAVFFVGVALWELTRAFGSLISLSQVGRYAFALLVAAVLTIGSARYYFGPYQQSWRYGSFNGEVSTAIGYTVRHLGPDWKQYFFGAPRMWAEFGSAVFIAKNPFLDVVEPLTGPPEFVDPAYNAVFIFLPERIADLQWVQSAYPDGELRQVRRVGEREGPALFTSYIVQTKLQH